MTATYCHLLHTSDIHLDDKLGGPGEESYAQLGLMGVVDKALALDVDLFLLAGDLFDHNRVKAPCLRFATEQLARLRCPVVMITGNHDCMTDYSVYQRFDPRDAGDHIYFINEEQGGVLSFPEWDLKIWGRGIVDHHPENKPLEGVPGKDHNGWYIGMVHGYYVERGAGMYSSLITPDEIEASQLDYLAMGHVHVFSEVRHGRTQAVYPGSPNVNQGTREMTAAHVEFKPGEGVQVNRVELDTGMPEARETERHVHFTPGA
ncbi:MAG: DNA repair exonuclease [Proteobacteria bacterium]|nr:DNA repair exonuclease [Pseudomonadota bacterium]MDA1300171.1 DNA repair exonuclease [Pseudomonadota bacterium]